MGIAEGNTRLSRTEQIKRFQILPAFWEPGGDVIHYQAGNALADARTESRTENGTKAVAAFAEKRSPDFSKVA